MGNKLKGSSQEHISIPIYIWMAYRFDPTCAFRCLPQDLFTHLMSFHSYQEFLFEHQFNIKSTKYHPRAKFPYSITSGSATNEHLNEGWGRTGLISRYVGYLTLKFKQSGVNKTSFWSTIGLKTEPEEWKGPGHDFHLNTPGCFFFYRMDQGIVYNNKPHWRTDMAPTGVKLKQNGGGLVYPMINNSESHVTLVTFYFDAEGNATLVKCNKFEVPKENNPSFPLPPEFYLFVDIYYPGTTCSLYGDFKHDLYNKHKCKAKASFSTYYADQI